MTSAGERDGDGAAAAAAAVSRLSHALRNPLAVILGYAELLGVRRDEATLAEAPPRIKEAAEQLSLVVDDLLTVFALDAGVLPVATAPVDLGWAVDEALRPISAASGNRSFVLRSVDPVWPRVVADDQHLIRILTNLLLNACRRSSEGHEIVVAVERKDGHAAVSVSDGGVALTSDELERVFDRFSSVRGSGGSEARTTGLELYKVRRLVEVNGGTITAESDPDGGARFTFSLPLGREEEE